MTKIDSRVIEAAQDLGSNGFQVLLRVILPCRCRGSSAVSPWSLSRR